MNNKTYFGIAAALALTLMLGITLAAAPVEAKGKGKATKILWSQPRIQTTFQKGAVIQTTLTFTPTGNIANASFRTSGSMTDTITIDPPVFATLTAGTPYTVSVTFTAPTEGKRKRYNGVTALVDDTKLYAKPLKLRFSLDKVK